jgi:DNA-directed RNA polymerase subunit M/transcription elongation factor TFIIS
LSEKEMSAVEILIMPKSCPRCNGDLFIDRDQYGLFLQCLQCGYLRDLHMQFGGEERMSVKGKEPVLAFRSSSGKDVQNGSIG